MYVNCKLRAHTKGSEHCIGCHSHGCHVTDTNTLLMIGRPNYSPHFHCTKFDSGDMSFWERYLSANDVETLCGAPTGKLHVCDTQTTNSNLRQESYEKENMQNINHQKVKYTNIILYIKFINGPIIYVFNFQPELKPDTGNCMLSKFPHLS